MIRIALAVAGLCVAAAIVLALAALRALWRQSGWALARPLHMPGTHARAGVLASDGGETVRAPFSDREVLWVRSSVTGIGPDGSSAKVLWSKEISAPAVLRGNGWRVKMDWVRVRPIVIRWYRRGALKVLGRESPSLQRVLARAGYAKAPPGSQFFELEEEWLCAGDRVRAHGLFDEESLAPPPHEETAVVTTLIGWRVVLREAWGPVLALWFSMLAAAAGMSVLVAWWWLR